MLPVIRWSLPLSETGSRSVASTFSATRAASASSARLVSRIANSSPPSRAPVSLLRRHVATRWAARRNSASPARCPSESLIALEAVEVEEEHAELLAVAPRRRDRLIEAVLEERAVREAGELVVGGELAGPLAGDVQLEEHALVADRVLERPDQRTGAERALQQIAARSDLHGLARERLVVVLHHHHDRYERRAHARLRDRDELARAPGADVHQQDVDLVALQRLEGVLEIHRVGERDLGLARVFEQRAQQLGIGRRAVRRAAIGSDPVGASRPSSASSLHIGSASPRLPCALPLSASTGRA